MKSGKASGKSEVTLEEIRLLSLAHQYEFLHFLNEWWTTKVIPPEHLIARVVSLFKNGNPAEMDNYRPISLLEVSYNIFAGILKRRIEKGIEPLLQKVQYGFRARMSTIQPLYIILALKRFRVPQHLIDLVSALYSAPTFYVTYSRAGDPTRLPPKPVPVPNSHVCYFSRCPLPPT